MQPLKDNSRHGSGVGVEMTMSLSGPPGLHRHTTLPTDSIYHYMNRQQPQQTELQHKLLPGGGDRKTPVTTRVTSVDHRLGNHDSIGLSRDHRLASGHEVRQSTMELASHDTIREVEILSSKESGRIISEHHSQQMPQQHSQHLGVSRKYSDVRNVIGSHDKPNITAESGATRDAVQLGQSLGSSRPGSSHSSQQSQLSLQDPRLSSVPMTGVYSYELQSPYAHMAMNSMISAGVPRKSSSIQLSPSGPPQSLSASVGYSVQKSARSGDSLVSSGLHSLHGHDTTHPYISSKQMGMYPEDYNKSVVTGHFLPELMKIGSVNDNKPLGQHRDLIRETHSDYSDSHYSPGSRSISNPAMEITSHSKHAADATHTVTGRTAVDDQVQKSASFINTHTSFYSKGRQSQSSISKGLAYQPGPENIPRGGPDPLTSVSHLQNSSNMLSAQHPMYPRPQVHQDTLGPFSDPEQHISANVLKSTGVIRPPVHTGDERTWNEGYHPLAKQTGPTFHHDDLISRGSKNCIPHHRDLDSSHPPMHSANAMRMQGSISTGQPRIMYDSGHSKSVSYSDILSHPSSADRFSVSQKELASSRPSSVGRSTHLPPNISVIPREDRSLPDQSEQSVATVGGVSGSAVSGISGAAALDLTKLHTGTGKPVDSPLDLTVKTKKRHVEDRETPEYDRMLFAAKRQKLDTSSPRSGISCPKGALNVTENSPNAVWLSSPSPRGPDNYEHRSVPLTIYTSHASSTPTLTRTNKYAQSHLSDGRMSTDQRISRDRLSADSHINRDGRVSVESRSSIDHQTLSLSASQGKMYSSSMIPDMVRHVTGTNPPMVPLTTQLQKVKEEQAYQMKLQRMSTDSLVNIHTDPKQAYKDTVNLRHLELASQSPNEVVVVRHSQQHYDLADQSQQSNTQHSFIKQQQQCLDVQQMQQTHHHQKLLNNQQEIIELGMKDSSDPLQASRASTFSLRGFTSQSALIQQSQQHHIHQQQQTCVVQQHKYSPKEQQQQLSAYSQQVLYSKEPQQQSYTKEQLQFLSQQHYSRTQYSSKRGEDMDYFYHKQQQQQFPSRKRSDVDGYKQTLSTSQSTFAGAQKWNMSHQQRPVLKSAYPHTQPNTSAPGDYRAAKLPAVYTRSPANARMPSGREYDGYRYGYTKSDRLKLSDSEKSSLPQIAGPLPAGGVREESRRALSRRVSYSGSSAAAVPVTDSNKQLDNTRKKSSSSLPERIEIGGKAEANHGKSGTSVSRASEKSEEAMEDSVKLEMKGAMSPALLSQAIPLPNTGSCVIPDLLASDSLSNQSSTQFVVPLSLTIPQTPSPLASSTPSPAGPSSSRPASSHKAWSRKHMILNAVNQDESLKRIICSNGSKHESGGLSAECKNRIIASSTCSPVPTSPKMPILSPQDDDDDDGEVASEEQDMRKQAISDDPPTLDPSHMGQNKPTVSRSLSLSQPVVATGTASAPSQSCSSVVIPDNLQTKEAYRNNSLEVFNGNSTSFPSATTSSSAVAKETSVTKSDELSVNAIVVRRCTIGNTLPDQQIQQQHEESQKIQPGSVQFQRAEVIRRNSLAGHGLGPWGHMKNIPVANVAPFIHSRDDDDKSKQKLDDQHQIIQQIANFPNTDSTYILSGQTQEAPKEVISKPDIPKQNVSTELNGVDIKHNTGSQEKSDSNLTASSSNKNDSRKKKLTKLRVSSPTKMKELELISPTLEYAVLKSASMEDIKVLDKLSHGSLRKSLENRLKYKHKIVREKNSLIKPKKTVKKRIQYVFDDDEDEDEPDPVLVSNDDDDEDEDFEVEDGNKGMKNSSKSDAEAKARDREERALRREQLRDQSEENASRYSTAASSQGQTSRSSSGSKNRTRSKESLTSEKHKPTQTRSPKAASRISRRRMSSTNQRAQELKHNALVQRRKTGKRKVRRYNRNAAYEQELHREANRRAVVRAKRQASSKARERLQQQRDLTQDADNDDNLLDETWKLPETKGTSGSGRKSHQHISPRLIVPKAGSKSHSSSHSSKTSASSSGSQQRKEDYESDVENVPDDLAAEMASDDNSGKKKKVHAGKCRTRREDADQDPLDGQDTSGLEDDPDYEDDSRGNVMSSIPIEIVPVPADVKKLTINKNSGETLLHRAARIGHEEITLYCLKTQIVDVNARDHAGYTPLHESCVRGSVAVARHLIYHGADVNCCSQDGIRPIHDAIENDHLEVVRLLLVHGADPLIATYAGRTPLRIARSLLMLQTLQGYIADLNGWPGVDEEEEDYDREEDDLVPWRFTSSLTFLESCQLDSYTPCVDLPDDPPDDSSDVFDDGPTSAISVFNLALDGEDRTPQPFCLLDDVINRLNMSEDKLTVLFPWKPTSVTLSSERVREVASCCCSNVSIRLPQSGKVTLLPFSALNKIEQALKQQMIMKVKKEGGDRGSKEVVKKITSSSCVPILTRLEQANSFLEDEHQCPRGTAVKNLSSTCLSSKQKVKFAGFTSIFQSAPTPGSTSLATSSTPTLHSTNSGTPKTSKSQPSSSHSWTSSSSEVQSNKKASAGHRHHHHQLKQHPQHQHSQPRSSSGGAGETSLAIRVAGSTSKDARSSSSSTSTPRKSKKEDCDSPWLNTPMFSDDSSSSPFHTGLDYFDSDNSI